MIFTFSKRLVHVKLKFFLKCKQDERHKYGEIVFLTSRNVLATGVNCMAKEDIQSALWS